MKGWMAFFLAAFGSPEDFLETRQGGEADFWQRSRGSVWQAARQWPGGMGWWYVGKRLLMRGVLPPLLVFCVSVTLLLAGFGGWVATQESRDTKVGKQAFDALENRIERAKQGVSRGEK